MSSSYQHSEAFTSSLGPSISPYDVVRNVCRALGGRMHGQNCRAPAPGKGPNNDSMIIMPNAALSGAIAVHLHNDPNNLQACLALKDHWRNMGWIPDTRRKYTCLTERKNIVPARVNDEYQQKALNRAKRVWTMTSAADGTLAHDYLSKTRGIGLENLPLSIRYHHDLSFWHQRSRIFSSPAMVCKIVNAATGLSRGVHVTYLSANACKHPDAPKGQARKMFGISKGGCIRLGEVKAVHAVAEGLESALAFTKLFGTTCDAALSADGLANYTPPKGCEGLLICHDNDASGVGQRAGRSLAARMVSKGVECGFKPSLSGSDWNDFLLGAKS